jgi:hypothetical protein
MALTRDVIVQFITKLNDKGIKNATKSTQKYEGALGRVSKIGIAAYAALSAAAIKFGEMSVKNALADEKAQRILALSLKNSAGASQGVVDAADAQIDKIQRLTGVSDDQLRPALSRIARSTGEVSSAFDMLNLAIDISKGTQKDLGAVSVALSKAVDGNFIALQRLGVGLDKDLLATKDFNKIFGELRRNFAGFAAAEADTVEGKLARLKVAADEASEVIGQSLVNAVIAIGSSAGSIEETTKKFDELARSIADTITGISNFISIFTKFGDKTFKIFGKQIDIFTLELIPILGTYIRMLKESGEASRIAADIQLSNMRQVTSARNAEMQAEVDRKKALEDFIKGLKAEEAKQRAAAKAAADRAKQEKLSALAKAKSDRDNFLRQQLAKQFDTDAISLQVALTRQLSEEDKKRVNALIALQEDDVQKQMDALAELNGLYTKHYEDRIANIGKVAAANKAEEDARREAILNPPKPPQAPSGIDSAGEDYLPFVPPAPPTPGAANFGMGVITAEEAARLFELNRPNFGLPTPNNDQMGTINQDDFYDYGMEGFTGGGFGGNVTNVNVSVEGSVLTQGQDLGFLLSDIIGNLNRQGNPVTLGLLGR